MKLNGKNVRKSSPYSDFNSSQPNHVQVGRKYVNSGNVCLGIERVINGNSKTWRFGKHPMSLNTTTFIDIGGQTFIQLETHAVLKYINENRWKLRLIENKGFNGMFTRSYLANINDLVTFCKDNSSLKHVA